MSDYSPYRTAVIGVNRCTQSDDRSIGGGVILFIFTIFLLFLWLTMMRNVEGIRDLILVCTCFFLQTIVVSTGVLRWWRCDGWTGWWLILIGSAVLWVWQLRLFIKIRRIVPVYD